MLCLHTLCFCPLPPLQSTPEWLLPATTPLGIICLSAVTSNGHTASFSSSFSAAFNSGIDYSPLKQCFLSVFGTPPFPDFLLVSLATFLCWFFVLYPTSKWWGSSSYLSLFFFLCRLTLLDPMHSHGLVYFLLLDFSLWNSWHSDVGPPGLVF